MSSPAVGQLVGIWLTDPEDVESLCTYGQVTLEFTADGGLIYTVHNQGKDQIILLTYRAEGEVLITDQPSAPREEQTPFVLTPDGKLILLLDGIPSSYIRQ